MIKLLTHPNAFPVFIMCTYACTSTRYAFAGDWGRVVYWIAAGLITFSVTFLVKH